MQAPQPKRQGEWDALLAVCSLKIFHLELQQETSQLEEIITGWGSKQPDLAVDVSDHCREVGPDGF